ncbi:MAG: hypothetical protein NTX04_02325 [Verrucomicrobia bacterium]|nr:hypothetical protein [Verrucomicrobiota bacterium]
MEIWGVFGTITEPLTASAVRVFFLREGVGVSVVEVRQKIQHKRIAPAERV